MRKFRFTLWHLMTAVAFVAVLSSLSVWFRKDATAIYAGTCDIRAVDDHIVVQTLDSFFVSQGLQQIVDPPPGINDISYGGRRFWYQGTTPRGKRYWAVFALEASGRSTLSDASGPIRQVQVRIVERFRTPVLNWPPNTDRQYPSALYRDLRQPFTVLQRLSKVGQAAQVVTEDRR